MNGETGRILEVNPYLLELIGFSKQEFLDKDIWNIGFLKDVIANKENFVELQKQKYIRYDNLPLETASGRQIDVEFISNAYEINHHKFIQCNIRTISLRKEVEIAMKKTDEMNRISTQNKKKME